MAASMLRIAIIYTGDHACRWPDTMLRLRTLSFSLVLLLTVGLAYAQNEASFSLSLSKRSIPVGEAFAAVIQANIEPGWHMYSTTQPPGGPIPTSIKLGEGPVFEAAGALESPPPEKSFDENFNLDTEYYQGDIRFEQPVRSKADVAPGKYELAVKVRYMLCNDRMCLPPQTVTLKAEVALLASARSSRSVPAGGERSGPSPTGGQPSTISVPSTDAGGPSAVGGRPSPPAGSPPVGASSEAQSGIPLTTAAYIWFAMAMGGLALLTPCVFPMIPITVSYFTKRQSATRAQAVWEAFVYSAGIVLTFTLLGFGLTFLFGAGGINRLAASATVNMIIALVFIAFALSLFGAFEFQLPSRWLTAVNRQSTRSGGLIGILLMALTFSLTSFTCTVPFVGTVMVAALQGDWLWSLLGVTAFAIVFAAPFFLLALFPSILKSLPRSGGWMESVKVTMGFLELAAAVKFLSNVDLVFQWQLLTRPAFIAIWLAIALLTAVYLLGWIRLPHEAPSQTVGVVRVLSAIFFLAIGFYLLRGLFGFPLGEVDAFMPPRDYGSVESSLASPGSAAAEARWLTDYGQALALARAQNRPVFVDFTGYTCTNCRWMESNMFPTPRVDQLMRQYVLVRLYTDGEGEEYARNLELERRWFGTIALPYYALITPDDKVVATFPGLTRDVSTFVSFLEKGLKKQSRGVASQAP
jgi:thiol:disulfide interchange protein